MTTFADSSFFNKKSSVADLIDHEMQQFKLNQSLRLKDYIKQRIDFLKKQENSELSLEFISGFRPKIGVFAGSFSPFHKGHYNVLQKAEKIFDKVIIAFGKNPEKDTRGYKVPKSIKDRQLEEYDGLLTDFVTSLGHDVVVIRGLRNSTDFQYEQNQYRYIQELMPDVKIINIFCDKEFEHISSSGIRTLEKYNKHTNYLLD
jgi:pantetheine-phosphate adenylyltransferase